MFCWTLLVPIRLPLSVPGSWGVRYSPVLATRPLLGETAFSVTLFGALGYSLRDTLALLEFFLVSVGPITLTDRTTIPRILALTALSLSPDRSSCSVISYL
ncbi:uncharacterized protein BDW43DRAFT_46292 [Aspergillus alliaceus]|uniref:uncharacterized protein n=1 Tax=Petromyces alliaceus TaxID=209559 RepID=UPI0012A53DB2|nr:uncharacterized protein BDW43DRAFT_46292 [Aspergillus alliaceus]KAB8234902.1 hypothetical protein BDW43DRAFT_46292 [Aspergillus alliaceus]